MSADDKQQLEELFDAGISIENARNYLLERAGKDMKEELASLWACSSEAETLFDMEALDKIRGAVLPPLDTEEPPEEKFRIIRSLASGGMGMVYQAQQTYPIRRIVALKVLDTGRVSEDLLARFRFEGQVLAMMEHPFIARVYDSGVTSQNDPFIAMEYLDGLPITQYCDKNRLTIEERLRLFMKVCDGLQHAHQKGVIHRDIKPSNILVIEHDGQAMPKIIDFGIAKFTGESLISEPKETRKGMVIGTPHYMSPEQAAGLRGQIDTRTDLYSLGVLFHELLVGVIPLDELLDRETSLKECCRIIQEVDPPEPSRRIVATEDQFRRIADTRGLSPLQLIRRVSGDLDWITLKALSKSPGDRYASCSQFNTDIRYHLENRPILAAQPGATYHFRKFLKRYRSQVATVSVFLLVVIAAVTAFYNQERTGRKRASRMNGYLIQLVRTFVPENEERQVLTTKALDEIREQVDDVFRGDSLDEASFRQAMGIAYNYLDDREHAIAEFREALRISDRLLSPSSDKSIEILGKLAMVLKETNDPKQAEGPFQKHVDLLYEQQGACHPDTLTARLHQAFFYHHQMNDRATAEKLFRQIFEDSRDLGPEHEALRMRCQTDLAGILATVNRLQEAQMHFEQALPGLEESLGKHDHIVLYTKHNYANLFYRLGDYQTGIRLHRENLDTRRAILFPGSRRIRASMLALVWGLRREALLTINKIDVLKQEAAMLTKKGLPGAAREKQKEVARLTTKLPGLDKLLAEAEHISRETYRMDLRTRDLKHPSTIRALDDLVSTLRYRNKLTEALHLLEELDCLNPQDLLRPDVMRVRNTRAFLLLLQARYAEAASMLDQLLIERLLHPDHDSEVDLLLANIQIDRGLAYSKLGQPDAAFRAFLWAVRVYRPNDAATVRRVLKTNIIPFLLDQEQTDMVNQLMILADSSDPFWRMSVPLVLNRIP